MGQWIESSFIKYCLRSCRYWPSFFLLHSIGMSVVSVLFPRRREICELFYFHRFFFPPGTTEIALVGSSTEWDMLGAGLDLARVRARNENPGGTKTLFDQFVPRQRCPSRNSMKNKNLKISPCYKATEEYWI